MTIQDKLREDADKYRRWNFDCDDDGIVVCKGDHEKSDHCEMHEVRLSPAETLAIITELRDGLLRLYGAIADTINTC